MGKFDQCLLLSDMDGTFLDNESKLIPRNLEAARYFMEEGGYFSLATGRAKLSVQNYVDTFPINAPALLYNGGLMYDYAKNEIIHAEYLPPQAHVYIEDIMSHFPELNVMISKVDGDYIVQSTPMMHKWYTDHESANAPIYAPLKEVSDPWMKLIFLSESKEMVHDLMVHCSRWTDVSYIRGDLLSFEMMLKGTSKGSSLLYLADHLKVPYENTFAIGNYENDIAMVSVAEVGAMPSNAPEEIQKYADIIVGSNVDGGVADFIEYLDGLY